MAIHDDDENDPDDVPWLCMCCRETIDGDGVSFFDDPAAEKHVCSECWHSLTPAQRIQLTIDYRRSTFFVTACQAVEDICTKAMNGFNFFGRHEPGNN